MSKVTKRKHVTKELEEDLSLPTNQQTIVQLIDSRGNNLHEVIDNDGVKFLVSMPVKFRRNIWVKRGNYVLVEPIHEGDKVKAEISKILTKEHIKYYRSQNIWPKQFDKKNIALEYNLIPHSDRNVKSVSNNDSYTAENDSEDDLFVNTNRNCGTIRNDKNRNTANSSDSSSESD